MNDSEMQMDWRPLHRACWEGDPATVRRLLLSGADPNRLAPTNWRQRPLHRALEFRVSHPKHEGHVQVVKLLLRAGADATVRATTLDMTPWELASFCGLDPAERVLRKYQRKSPKHPNGMPTVWLESASRLPESKALRRLPRLLNLSSINVVWRGATPLMVAAGHAAHWRVADTLLERGADPSIGSSLLHASCHWHFEHLIPALKYMASHGWQVNQADPSGQSALHKAAFLGYSAAVRTLLEVGANSHLRDREGATPADVARRWRKSAVLKLIS